VLDVGHKNILTPTQAKTRKYFFSSLQIHLKLNTN